MKVLASTVSTSISALNTAVTFTLSGAPVAPSSGVVATIVGAAPPASAESFVVLSPQPIAKSRRSEASGIRELVVVLMPAACAHHVGFKIRNLYGYMKV